MRGLVKARPSSDVAALRTLAEQDEVRNKARAPAQVRLLWDACQLPDFHKLSAEEHARLVRTIFLHLTSGDGTLPEDWLAKQIARLDVSEGGRGDAFGTPGASPDWTYAANRPGWVKDSAHWQEVTHAVEDRLSDALHERLTQRFIDRRTSVLMRQLALDDIDLVLDDSGGVAIGARSSASWTDSVSRKPKARRAFTNAPCAPLR